MKRLIYLALVLTFIACTKNKQNSISLDKKTTEYSDVQDTQNNSTPKPTKVTPTESSTDFVPVITVSTTENTYATPSEDNNTRQYSNSSSVDGVDGVVVYEDSDDYFIIETRRGFTVCERYSGWLSVGDRVRGELNHYGFKTILKKNSDSEIRIYIEDYMLSEESAFRWFGENRHLDSTDQDCYDSNN